MVICSHLPSLYVKLFGYAIGRIRKGSISSAKICEDLALKIELIGMQGLGEALHHVVNIRDGGLVRRDEYLRVLPKP
tara:strand:+ start:880 stop:1110 length:231 start_codon:yes stop_codon:yes gene_type:complete